MENSRTSQRPTAQCCLTEPNSPNGLQRSDRGLLMVDRALTPRELSRRWRCRLGKVKAMISDGALAAIEIDGRMRILPESIHAAEAGTLAVRPRQSRKREIIPREIAEILG